MMLPESFRQVVGFICLAILLRLGTYAVHSENVNWSSVGGDKGNTRYSELKQINTSNVHKLTTAWFYHTGDGGKSTTIECTPIVIEGKMYVTTAQSKVVALNAATGHELWKFDPYEKYVLKNPKASGGVNRGVAWWSDGKATRILFGAADGRLISLDASTGIPDPAFGKLGTVDLREDMGDDLSGLNYGPTSAPAVYRHLIIVGFSCPEGGRPAPGDPRAFDVRTGKQVWRFHTIPRPGEFGHESWTDDEWKYAGAANNWSGTTLDEAHGLVFIGTGSASPDFYGGSRKGDNLFANCTLCLDALTGKRIWHFQTLRHDLWDHDLPACPNLVTISSGNGKQDAVAQVSKTGFVYLFDRVTGKPVFPIKELAVPPSDIPGETASPTQPIPVRPPPFCSQSVTESELTDISPEAHEASLQLFRKYRGGPAFTPPCLQGTIVVPGFHGGATWSGACIDPSTGILYVNSNNQPNIARLIPGEDEKQEPYRPTGYFKFLDKEGYPAVKPPWGLLNAIDLNKGEFVWRVPLGEFPELKARGIAQTGTENFGGAIVTSGGLIFIGATKDEMFHAFDKATGNLLWQSKLDAGGYATPCTYMADGRQYIVIAAGGGGKLGTKSGDAFVAFTLPGP